MDQHREATVTLQLRLPESLHAQLRALAQRERRSLNNIMVYLLAQAVERAATSRDPAA